MVEKQKGDLEQEWRKIEKMELEEKEKVELEEREKWELEEKWRMSWRIKKR